MNHKLRPQSMHFTLVLLLNEEYFWMLNNEVNFNKWKFYSSFFSMQQWTNGDGKF